MQRFLGLIAVSVAFGLPLSSGLNAQEVQGKAQVGDTTVRAEAGVDAANVQAGVGELPKANKASSLIGMTVRNRQDEKLGQIKDIVLDLESGRVSYVVLSAGGFLGIGDRQLAIPSNAFESAAAGEGLVLEADKQKIQNAPSIVQTNWPPPDEVKATGDSYWLRESDSRDAGGTASATVRKGRGESASGSADAKVQIGRDSGPDDVDNTFRGRITAVHPEARTITVSGESGSRTFKVADRPRITLKGNRNPTLTDLKVGYGVAIGYSDAGDEALATSIIRTDTGETR